MRRTDACFFVIFLTLSNCDVQMQNNLGRNSFESSEQVRLVCTNTNDTITELMHSGVSLGLCYGSSMFCSGSNSQFTISFDVSALPYLYYVDFNNGFDPLLCGDYTCTDTELGFSDSFNLSYQRFDNATYSFDEDGNGVNITFMCAFPETSVSVKWFVVVANKTMELKTEDTEGHITQFKRTSMCQSVSCGGENAKNVTFGLSFHQTNSTLKQVSIQVEVWHALFPGRIVIERSTNLYFAEDSNECISSPCQHKSTCHDGFGFYYCTCSNGFTGINCQIASDMEQSGFDWQMFHSIIWPTVAICIFGFTIYIILFYEVRKSAYWNTKLTARQCSSKCISSTICLYDKSAKYVFDQKIVDDTQLLICNIWSNQTLKEQVIQIFVQLLPFFQGVTFFINWILSLTKEQKEEYVQSQINAAARNKGKFKSPTPALIEQQIWNDFNPCLKWNCIVKNWNMVPTLCRNELSTALCALPHRQMHMFAVNIIDALQRCPNIDLKDILDDKVLQNVASGNTQASAKVIHTVLRSKHGPGFTFGDSDDGQAYAILTDALDKCFELIPCHSQAYIVSSLLLTTEALTSFIQHRRKLFKPWQLFYYLHLRDRVIYNLNFQNWNELSANFTVKVLSEHNWEVFQALYERYSSVLVRCIFNKDIEEFKKNNLHCRHMEFLEDDDSDIASQLSYKGRTFSMKFYEENEKKAKTSKYVMVTVQVSFGYGIKFLCKRETMILAEFQQLLKEVFTNFWIRYYLKQLPCDNEDRRKKKVVESLEKICCKSDLFKGHSVHVRFFSVPEDTEVCNYFNPFGIPYILGLISAVNVNYALNLMHVLTAFHSYLHI